MSEDWVKDINEMHRHYNVHSTIKQMDKETLNTFLQFRIDFIREELNELEDNKDNPEEVVDALVDICVVAIGTLDSFTVDAYKAWDEVLRANMSKTVGIKEGRPNPLGLPDLMKPDDWVAPDHTGNYGLLREMCDGCDGYDCVDECVYPTKD